MAAAEQVLLMTIARAISTLEATSRCHDKLWSVLSLHGYDKSTERYSFMNRAQTKFAHLLRYLWVHSPQQTSKRLAQIFSQSPVSETKQWASGKHKRWNRLPYFLDLFKTVSEGAGYQFDFNGRTVAEVGAGPALGFLPFALIEGASKTTIVEPGYSECHSDSDFRYFECRSDSDFRRDYLMPLFQTHSKLVPERRAITYGRFIEKMMKIQICHTSIEKWGRTGTSYDIIMSKSCLEYIHDIGSAVDNIAAMSSADSINVHYIDFTMHFSQHRTGTPFGATYQTSKDDNPEYYKNPGGILNLLRRQDFLREFEKRFDDVYFFPLVEYSTCMEFDRIHSDWSNYETDDLAIANGILLAIKQKGV